MSGDEVAKLDAVAMLSGKPFAARWAEPGSTLAIFIAGSGTAHCGPKPMGATSSAAGEITVSFQQPEPQNRACTADLTGYGWTIELADKIDGTAPVEVVAVGLDIPAGAENPRLTLEPDQVLP